MTRSLTHYKQVGLWHGSRALGPGARTCTPCHRSGRLSWAECSLDVAHTLLEIWMAWPQKEYPTGGELFHDCFKECTWCKWPFSVAFFLRGDSFGTEHAGRSHQNVMFFFCCGNSFPGFDDDTSACLSIWRPMQGCKELSFGGTNPRLIDLDKWQVPTKSVHERIPTCSTTPKDLATLARSSYDPFLLTSQIHLLEN